MRDYGELTILFLAAIEKILLEQGHAAPAGAGVGAAVRMYTQADALASAHK
jgi:hypothetical protein